MHIQVMTTTGKREEAARIAKLLVEKRLAACVQVIGPITSSYWWKNEVVEGEEWLCLIKTSRNLFEDVEKAIREVHPYEVPEILAVPVVAGNNGYLEWFDGEIRKDEESASKGSSSRGQ